MAGRSQLFGAQGKMDFVRSCPRVGVQSIRPAGVSTSSCRSNPSCGRPDFSQYLGQTVNFFLHCGHFDSSIRLSPQAEQNFPFILFLQLQQNKRSSAPISQATHRIFPIFFLKTDQRMRIAPPFLITDNNISQRQILVNKKPPRDAAEWDGTPWITNARISWSPIYQSSIHVQRGRVRAAKVCRRTALRPSNTVPTRASPVW